MGATVMDQVERLRAALAGRYTLDREVGRGGMAHVYRAHDRQHGRDVAIKVLRPEVASALGPERFLREIQIEARLQHPHILPLFDSGAADGFLYYVMPFVEGETLRARMQREKQLSLPEALRITREVADALSYAHKQGLVHRDIKPANILLIGEHALVADFGIAKAVSVAGQESLTESGIAIGTPEYMSPEQGTGDGDVDQRTDIYALGCVLYEMLAGQPPFSGRTVQNVLARHRQDTPPSLRVVRPGLPPAIEASIEKALAKVPADRFPTAAAFAASLTASESAGPYRAPWWSRRRITVALAAVVLAALAIAAVVLTRRHVPASSSPQPVGVVILPFDNSAGSRDSRRAAHVAFSEALDWVPGLRAIDGSPLLAPGENVRSTPTARLLRGAERLGGKYVVTGNVMPAGAGLRITTEIFAVGDGAQVVKAEDAAADSDLDVPVGRLAVRSIGILAGREGLDLGARKAAFSCTSSAAALGYLLQGQAAFWAGDYDRAATAYSESIEADSSCGLSYLRLSDVNGFRYDYAAALAALDAGLRFRPSVAARWKKLLDARRLFVMGSGADAIALFQDAVLDNRDDVDAWLGLGESLFHFAAYAGHSPSDAQAALERMARLDSSFVPIYDHLVDLALLDGDSARAAGYVRRMELNDPSRAVREAAIDVRFGGPAARSAAMKRLQGSDRQAMSQMIALWAHGAANLPLADTLASYLTGPDRTPDDRRRGGEFRMAILGAEGRWPDALAAWKGSAAGPPFDAWLVYAWLAGYPAEELVSPMFAWARSQVEAGVVPDFTRQPTDEAQQAFLALVHRAALMGDSAEVAGLLGRIRKSPASPDQADPSAVSARLALEARLALMSGDSARTIDLLGRAVSRIYEPFIWYYPLTSMAPERRLLSQLLDARGDSAGARRWRDSFRNSWSIGDVLFAARQ